MIEGKVGEISFQWVTLPRGMNGTARARLADGRLIDAEFRRDADGLWIELPHGVFGYDITAEKSDDGRMLYQLRERGGTGAWSELSFMRAGDQVGATAAGGAKKGVRVRAQMPGKIIRLHVQAGATVEKGQTILVMEAMKMENEIRAPQSGKVGTIKVAEGQAVETGADLCVIDPL
jgi:biotin carboxyl carrier protein